MVHITRGLAETLVRYGNEHDPDPVTISLSVTEASELDGTNLADDTPVFSHFFFPNTGGSVNFVFGVDLGTPPGQIQGRFVSHPAGDLGVSKRDDLAEVVFVAVPPWDLSSLAAFDRKGNQQQLELVDAEPPEERVS